MPVVTRSMSQRRLCSSSTSANGKARLSDKPSRDPFDSTNRSAPKKRSSISEKRRKAKGAGQSSQDPHKQPLTRSRSDDIEQPPVARESASTHIPDDAIMHWPCRLCSCPRGAFNYPINSCITCGHEMDDHDNVSMKWDPTCDFICERTELITSILQLARAKRVVVIRATPMSGKSTLLYLLGLRILHDEIDLEPVFIHWRPAEIRSVKNHLEYLEIEKSTWQETNGGLRPRNRKAKPIYLIDEAQNSYGEESLWSQTLKNHGTRSQALFVLVCLYGAAGVSRAHGSDDQSQALRINALQRVELRPSELGQMHILFKPEETTTTVKKWAIANNYKFEDGVPEYIHAATDGHPGIVGRVLQYFEICFPQLSNTIRRTRVWSLKLCHELIVEHHGLANWLMEKGRAFWNIDSEGYIEDRLSDPVYNGITLSDVRKALRQVATSPHGLTRLPDKNFDAFAFCHRMGLLYTEQAYLGSKELTYTFASPIHRRIAYRRLCPGLDPATQMKHLTLQQACMNAIQRFSPSALRPRSKRSPLHWGIPEAAFQDELYCCLNYELHNLPILSEFSHTKDGRVDFYIYEKKWCIEVLQCGSKTKIAEHVARFAPEGIYRSWNIFEDYIILNFCSKPSLSEIDIQDTNIQSHILQIVIDSEECTAEIYTCDRKLLATFALGEGRQRPQVEEFELLSGDTGAVNVLQARLVQVEKREQDTKQQMEQEREDMKQQMEQEREDMKQQIGQEREDMKQQIGQEREDMKQQMEQCEQNMKQQIEQQMEQREQDMKQQLDLMKQMLEAIKR